MAGEGSGTLQHVLSAHRRWQLTDVCWLGLSDAGVSPNGLTAFVRANLRKGGNPVNELWLNPSVPQTVAKWEAESCHWLFIFISGSSCFNPFFSIASFSDAII